MAWRINVEGVENLLQRDDRAETPGLCPSVDRPGLFRQLATGGTSRTIRPTPSPCTARRWSPPRSGFWRRSFRRNPADLAADGRQLQRPCRRDRLDSIAIQEVEAGHALFRRNPHAPLHRLLERTMRDNACASTWPVCYHAGGPRRLSLYQIAQIINRVGGYDPDLLMGCPRIKAGPIPPRAGNVSLDSSKLAAALGYEPLDPWPLEERWVPTHREWHRERSAR